MSPSGAEVVVTAASGAGGDTFVVGDEYGDELAGESRTEEKESEEEEKEDLTARVFREAKEVLEREPELCNLLYRTVLADGVETFEQAVASTITHRLMLAGGTPNTSSCFCPMTVRKILDDAFESPELEAGHTMADAVRRDALAAYSRDPACETVLEVILFYKGFASLVCHRAARRRWFLDQSGASPRRQAAVAGSRTRSFTALYFQSQASALFGVDIHPAASIGAGVLFDHGTGIVIGETAAIGDGCTLLHGVTLGGTGKIKGGDRHPKVGRNVLIGAGTCILGNVPVGDGAKIGAGSVVLGPIPSHATAVGAPAKIVGRAIEANPGSFMDDTLKNVAFLHQGKMKSTLSTSMKSISTLASTASDGDPTTTTNQDDTDEDEDDRRSPLTDDGGDDHSRHSEADRAVAKKDDACEEGDGAPLSAGGAAATSPSPDGNESEKKAAAAVTANNTKRRQRSESVAALSQVCCPYREYQILAKTAPINSITILSICKILSPEGCDANTIGQVFFSIDDYNRGYVAATDANLKRCIEAIKENTSISKERIWKLVAKLKPKGCG